MDALRAFQGAHGLEVAEVALVQGDVRQAGGDAFQKGGAVFSHVQIAPRQQDLFATRIAMGDADVLLGCDLVVTSSNEALSKVHTNRTRALVNTSESPTADFVRNPDWQFGSPSLAQQVREAVGDGECAFVDANALATALMGDAIYTNPFMLGYAWQQARVPTTSAGSSNLVSKLRIVPVWRQNALMVLAPPEYTQSVVDLIEQTTGRIVLMSSIGKIEIKKEKVTRITKQ